MEHQAHAPQHGPDMVALAVVAHFMGQNMTAHLRIGHDFVGQINIRLCQTEQAGGSHIIRQIRR